FNTNLDKYLNEIDKYNDEHFQNIKPSKKDIKILKKMDRKENDLTFFDKEIKQMSNILLNDNEEEDRKRQEKNIFIQRKREMKKINSGKGFKNKHSFKKHKK
ncbi:MAG: hypothetical protein MJ252_03305, partial [archaeon]|nr:hypothetical protein [archaeon]